MSFVSLSWLSSIWRGIVPSFDFPAKANTVQLLVLWSVDRIVAWSSQLRLVQLITRGPRDLEPHVVKFPLTMLSKKGGVYGLGFVSVVSPVYVVTPVVSLVYQTIFQANNLQSGSLSMISWRSLSLFRRCQRILSILNGPARVISVSSPWNVLAVKPPNEVSRQGPCEFLPTPLLGGSWSWIRNPHHPVQSLGFSEGFWLWGRLKTSP